ncbi:MAG: sigma-70 family RNA polymerase sigma factor [Planctomycetota bacterium]|nr:sigma-70 family RNA polymerase sigma factor [Planctomycetota bacterium]
MIDVTQILNAIEQGDTRAADKLLPLVYGELRLLAAQRLSREPPGQTLQATALVHEAYLRLVGSEGQNWSNRSHFFAAAAEAMRRLLVDNARRKKSEKRGGRRNKVDLDELRVATRTTPDDLIELDDALTKLAREDADVADLVKLRYFGGLTLEQAAEIKGISRRTAGRHWNYARLWLYREMTRADDLTV